ncbi:MAG: substrate-binding domain-containing protein [Hyphomicrobiales bacterium]|nr:substrate-binding domain-containing protein [Hyphomicrobiales bacterium]
MEKPPSAQPGTTLKVLAGGGIAGPIRELAAQFATECGCAPDFRFGTTPELINMATRGEPFDLAVVPRDVLQDAGARAQLVAGPTRDVARVGIGVAVRAGAPHPDIATPQALKQALLAARSLAAVPAGAAGTQMLRAFERLGVAEAMKARTLVQSGPLQVVKAVADGAAELGVFLSNVLIAPGIELVGPFPAELHEEVVFTAAIATRAVQPEAARAFIAHLVSPQAVALLKARGMTPC